MLVHELFALLRRAGFPRTRAVNELVGSVGAPTMASGDPDLVAALADEMARSGVRLSGVLGIHLRVGRAC